MRKLHFDVKVRKQRYFQLLPYPPALELLSSLLLLPHNAETAVALIVFNRQVLPIAVCFGCHANQLVQEKEERIMRRN
jgi:hypothetical protein